MPALSFVVLSYNYGRYLGACLDSILAQQDVHDFEVVVVADGCRDQTVAKVRNEHWPFRLKILAHNIDKRKKIMLAVWVGVTGSALLWLR